MYVASGSGWDSSLSRLWVWVWRTVTVSVCHSTYLTCWLCSSELHWCQCHSTYSTDLAVLTVSVTVSHSTDWHQFWLSHSQCQCHSTYWYLLTQQFCQTVSVTYSVTTKFWHSVTVSVRLQSDYSQQFWLSASQHLLSYWLSSSSSVHVPETLTALGMVVMCTLYRYKYIYIYDLGVGG